MIDVPVIVALLLLRLQTPPPVPSVTDTELPIHTAEVAGEIAAGFAMTVTVFKAEQPDEFVNEIVATPVPIPVTIPVPEPTVAALVAPLLQLPLLPSVRVVVVPKHTLTGPGGAMAAGLELIFTVAVTVQVPNV